MGRHGRETRRQALNGPRHRVLDSCISRMFVQDFDLPHKATNAGTAVLLALALTASTALSADFERGKAAFERGEYSVALSDFLPLAEQGHADAPYYLGRMYDYGRGVQQDRALAAQWFRKAANQGHEGAQFRLGDMYNYGLGVQQDYALAAQWYRKAADQGHAEAQCELGRMYHAGWGVQRDHALAVQWYRKAADQGHVRAQDLLGFMYHYGRGVQQDHALAARWYRKAADQGDQVAQFRLGVMYNHGRGVQRDHALAAQWFRKAADQGDAEAQFNLGVMYSNGWGVPQDYALAAQWYRKATDQGLTDAQVNLGNMHFLGEGVPQDDTLAVEWYRKAADRGNAMAQFNLVVMYNHGRGVQRDYVPAYVWTNLAAAQGHKEARELRDKLQLAMTSGQIAEAQALSREFQGRTERADTATPPNPLGPLRGERMPTGSGSGFLVGPNGKVLTNSHVVGGCSQVTVRHSGNTHAATIRASDTTNDLALLAVPRLSGETASFSESHQAALGETATVAGYPFGGLLASDLHVTSGIVSALAGLQDDSTRLQITAPVQPGNSGGPLLDESGNVIGVVVSRLNALGVARATGTIPQNVNFAIKGSVARMFLEIHGVPYGRANTGEKLSTRAVADLARGFTVAVECWE